MRTTRRLLAIALVVTACTSTPADPTSWQSDEFLAALPTDPVDAFITHVRAAVRQEHNAGTWVDDMSDSQLLDIAALWCDAGAERLSNAIEDELAARGLDVNPGREFLPPPPIDELMTAVAALHQPELCEAV